MARNAISYNIYNVDCDAYGEAFARMVLQNPKAKAEDVPGLRRDGNYHRITSPAMRENVHAHIKKAAKDLLLKQGYTPDIVSRVLG